MTLRVVYSLGSRFGTNDSLSVLARNDVQALLSQSWLQQLLVGSYIPGSVPSDRTRQMGLANRVIRKLAVYEPYGHLHALDGDVFDTWSARQIEACDVFHGWGQMALASLRRAHTLGAKTIIVRGSSHTLTQQRWLVEEYDRYGIPFQPTTRRSVEKALAEYAETDYVLVPSEFAYQSFLEHHYAEDKLILNPFGVDVERFHPGEGDGGQVRAVFVGQVSLRKGIQYVLEAWRKLRWPNAELTIIGPIMPDAQKVIAPYQSDPTIRWVGYVNNLEDYLGRMSFFVFPSVEEGSALVTYIALACGLPLVTTFNAGSVARDGQEGFIVPVRDVAALSRRMEQLARDAELRRTLGRAARQRAEAFTWAHYQARMVDLYRRHFRQ